MILKNVHQEISCRIYDDHNSLIFQLFHDPTVDIIRGQIERFLQKKEESGLYSLIAPITNFDYMKISNEEIVNLCGTMLRNIVENGDFDFVIVDTGNNIEDATYVSLERADEILLILTQSMNSANCNNNFLNTMNHLSFDLSKVRIVINKAKPRPKELESQ